MLPHLGSSTPSHKLHITHAPLPRHIDPSQPPTKRKPFSTQWEQRFVHTLDVLLPSELADVLIATLDKRKLEREALRAKVSAKRAGDARNVATAVGREREGDERRGCEVRYAKVTMALGDVLEAGFLDGCVKKGNVLMLSEGRPGVDEVYSLSEGTLSIELDKPTYERTGLVGKAIPDGGRKHMTSRYIIGIDLRQPSMLHGKKGFERIVWAFKNVLAQSKTWLFHDCDEGRNERCIQALAKHQPTHHTITSTRLALTSTRIPHFPPPSAAHAKSPYTSTPDWAADLHEYLSLLSLGSPRVSLGDTVDPYICRYSIPDWDDYCTPPASADGSGPDANDIDDRQGNSGAREERSVQALTRLRWTGFLPASFVVDVLGALRSVLRPPRERERRQARAADGDVMDIDTSTPENSSTDKLTQVSEDAIDVQLRAPEAADAGSAGGGGEMTSTGTQRVEGMVGSEAPGRGLEGSDKWANLQTYGFRDDHVTVLIPPKSGGGESVEWAWKGQTSLGL